VIVVRADWARRVRSRRAVYEFRCSATNTVTGAEWLEVWGGYYGRERLLAVHRDRVVAIPKRAI